MKRHHKGRRQSALTWLIISSFVTIISSSSSSSFSIEGVKEWPLILVYKLLFLSVSAFPFACFASFDYLLCFKTAGAFIVRWTSN